MSANGISRLPFKRDRQLAKLALAATNRLATGRRATVNLSQLPALYSEDNNNTSELDNNSNTGGLVVGRPWIE